MKRVVTVATAAASALLLALIAWKLRGPVVLLLLGAALASAAQVVIDALEARGLKRGLALALTYGSALVFMVGAVLALSGSFLADLRGSAETLGRTYERLSARLPEGGALAQLLAANLPPPRQLMNELSRSNPASLAGDALATSGWLLERLSAVLIVLILALHWTAAGDRLTRFGLVLIPAHRRAWARLVLADVASAVGRQLAGGLMKGYLALLVFAVGFRALGVPFPTLLAVIVAALAVVPLVGVLLGPGLVLAVTWNQAPGAAVSAALATAALMLLLDRVLARRLLDARRSNPVLEIVVLLVLARAVGPLGLLAAPAVAAILHITVEQLALRRTVLRTNTIEGIRERLDELRQQELLPELDSVASSLEAIADEAHDLVRRPVIGPIPGGPSTGGPSGELPRQPPGLVPPRTATG
jgi:predicted PurR-regulated permease PerM